MESLAVEYLTQRGYRQRLPDVINIGAKKAGTTVMSWLLAHHPRIAHAQDIETHFFDKYLQLGVNFYKSRMTFASDEQLSFEKTPRYFVDPIVPELMKKLVPQHVKFIVCVRDPIDRAISDFGHLSEINLRQEGKINDSHVTYRTQTTEGIRFTSEVMNPTDAGCVRSNHSVIDTSVYTKHVQRWLRHFSLAKFHFVDHAQLMSHPYSELTKIETFLNISTFFQPEMFYHDAKKGMPCMTGRCMAQNRLYILPKARPNTRTINKLGLFFEPHNKLFFDLIGREFPWLNQANITL